MLNYLTERCKITIKVYENKEIILLRVFKLWSKKKIVKN